MHKKIIIILFLIILSHCSLNHPVSMWKVEEENTNSDITKLNFENETSFDEFKSKPSNRFEKSIIFILKSK